MYTAQSTLSPKQQMLANLKAQAEARKQVEGAERPNNTLLGIESTTKPVKIMTTQPPSLKDVSRMSMFANRFRNNERPQTTESTFQQFAVIGDPEILVEAGVAPSNDIYAIEMNLPPELRPEYDQFKAICTEHDIPAGMMSLLWKNLLNDHTIINIDTSGSMGITDVQRPEPKTPLEKNFNVEVSDFGENRVGMQIPSRQTRMAEAKDRFKQIMPILMAANRRGVVHLKSYSNQKGVNIDMRSTPYNQAVDIAKGFIDSLHADLDHTPSVSQYHASCLEAVQSMRSGRTESATIIEATDGMPNERLAPNSSFEPLYKQYYDTVFHQNSDYRREDGQIIPNREARAWNMDQNTPQLMRRLSVLAGHYAIPTTFAACTNNDEEIGELNEVDTLHNTVAVLDDIDSEQKEVIRQQGPRFPLNLSTFLALYFVAPKEVFADAIDERPLTPEQLEQYLGYYPGHEAYLENLDNTQTSILAKAEQTGFIKPQRHSVPVEPPTAKVGDYRPMASNAAHYQQPSSMQQPGTQQFGYYGNSLI